jgi:hypothetical protein
MALRSGNSLLWLALGKYIVSRRFSFVLIPARTGLSLGFVAARRIVRDLYQVRELTEITRPENDERMISQGTEDGNIPVDASVICILIKYPALKLETLQKLTESPSYELRGAYVTLSLSAARLRVLTTIEGLSVLYQNEPRRNPLETSSSKT